MLSREQQKENQVISFCYDQEHLRLLLTIHAVLVPIFAFGMFRYIGHKIGILDWGFGTWTRLLPGATLVWLYQFLGDLVFWFGCREAIIVDDSGITIRKHFRTKHHKWEKVGQVEITQKLASVMDGNYHLTLKSQSGKKMRHIRLFGLTGSADEISAAIEQHTTVIRNSAEETRQG